MSEDSEPGVVELADGVWVQESELHFTFVRSGGPGGQAVNKLATKARLRVRLEEIQGLDDRARRRLRRLAGSRLTQGGELVIAAETYRTQRANRLACLERLRSLVADALAAPRPRRPTRPPRAAIERRLAEKRRRGERKEQRRPPPDES